MKALCCLMGFVGGFIRSRLVGHLHTVLVTIPSRICCYGVVGFDFEPPCVTAYRFTWYGLVYVIGVCTVGYDGYYAKRLALGLVSISWLCFYISIIRVFLGKPRGLCPTCSRCYLLANEEPLLLCS
jgi:hypothetical protein